MALQPLFIRDWKQLSAYGTAVSLVWHKQRYWFLLIIKQFDRNKAVCSVGERGKEWGCSQRSRTFAEKDFPCGRERGKEDSE